MLIVAIIKSLLIRLKIEWFQLKGLVTINANVNIIYNTDATGGNI